MKNTALLIMDIQQWIVGRVAGETSAPLLSNINAAIEAARKNNILLIFVTIRFRTGAPEISSNNKSFSSLKENLASITEEQLSLHPSLALKKDDIVIIKKRISAFAGSDLELILNSNNIDHLVLTGLSTSGVVLSTLREAADKDYQLTVLSDCCGDPDSDVHDLLINKIFSRQADILKHDEWMKTLA